MGVSASGMKGNAGECQGNVREWRQSARGTQVNEGEYRGMPGERIEVGAKCQGNAGECQGNVWEWVQTARGMQGNAGECRGNIWEWVYSAKGMQGTTRGM